ncbi:RIKEN cDNA 1700029F12 [Mus musculus]|nr:RIKEN cDNA 1700029F12 [Mus musculus]
MGFRQESDIGQDWDVSSDRNLTSGHDKEDSCGAQAAPSVTVKPPLTRRTPVTWTANTACSHCYTAWTPSADTCHHSPRGLSVLLQAMAAAATTAMRLTDFYHDYQPLSTEDQLSTEEPDANVYQVDPDGESQLHPKTDDAPRQQEAA